MPKDRYRLQFSFNATDPVQVAAYQYLSQCKGRTNLIVDYLSSVGALGGNFHPPQPSPQPQVVPSETSAAIDPQELARVLAGLLGPQLAQAVKDVITTELLDNLKESSAENQTNQESSPASNDVSFALESLSAFGI